MNYKYVFRLLTLTLINFSVMVIIYFCFSNTGKSTIMTDISSFPVVIIYLSILSLPTLVITHLVNHFIKKLKTSLIRKKTILLITMIISMLSTLIFLRGNLITYGSPISLLSPILSFIILELFSKKLTTTQK